MSLSVTSPQEKQDLATRDGTPVHLRSEEIIVQAPFSYAGSTKPILRAMAPWARHMVERFNSRDKVGFEAAVQGAISADSTLRPHP
jgi:hypothetical protein